MATDQEAMDRDKIGKEKGREYGDRKRKATEDIDVNVGDKVYQKNIVKSNKITPEFDSTPHTIVSKKGDPIEPHFGIEAKSTSASSVILKQAIQPPESCPNPFTETLTERNQETNALPVPLLHPSLTTTNPCPSAVPLLSLPSIPVQVESTSSNDSRDKRASPNKRKRIVCGQLQQLRKQIRNLKRINASATKRLTAAKKVIRTQNIQKLTENFTPFQQRFFACQLRNIKTKPKARNYTTDEKLDALLLWKSSPGTYKLLNRIGFNLPTTATLRKLLRQIPLSPGISQVVFNGLASKVRKMTNGEKLCMFDEMAIQPHLDYDLNKDSVVGFEKGTKNIADHATVFMIRGIFKKWKQPVGYMFHSFSMPAPTIVRHLKELVVKCENIGLNIIASVCDQGTNNVKAISMLFEESKRKQILLGQEPSESEVLCNKSSFVPLFDPPHLLKSIRNNLLTKDLLFTVDGTRKRASWTHIEHAYNIDKSNNIRMMRKIHDLHVVRHKIKKMKVSIAAQIFSATVASAIKYCALSGIKSTDGLYQLDISALDTAELLLIFNNLFDSVNGSSAKCRGKIFSQLVSPKSPHCALLIKTIHHQPRDANCEDDFSEPVTTIKEMIQPISVDDVPDRWHVPDPGDIVNIDVSDIECVTLGYVSGFISNQLLKRIPDCDTCRSNLLHNDEHPDEFHHKLISLKEYDPEVSKLKYSSVDLLKKFNKNI
ncbi:hypothetical protein NQ315_015372 [Exocentrus adspersus]|uniref:Transposase n=1 Tax=Exocentrus adspersus TaxID=1586481 RepID=A0AAV8VKC8_9CUCU|nr:hypothetical protein NQ315_015372 [Exocentrus adspersus]